MSRALLLKFVKELDLEKRANLLRDFKNPRVRRVMFNQARGMLGNIWGKTKGFGSYVGSGAKAALKNRIGPKALANAALGMGVSKLTGGSALEGILPTLMFGGDVNPYLNAAFIGATNLSQRANAAKLKAWDAPEPGEAYNLGVADMEQYSPSKPISIPFLL